ncbi:hypothetical protein K0B04_02380 [Patescibacteria group bacterium]|nr:hypothetical protein [Patescibacteria group bacterium]
MKNKIKKVVALSLICFFMFFLVSPVRADDDFTSIEELKPMIETIFNAVFVSLGLVFVGVIAFGIWKSSLSVGDPRGLEGAKQTWTYALYGFLVVIFVFAIFNIISRWFGILPIITPKDLLESVFNAIYELLDLSYQTSGS